MSSSTRRAFSYVREYSVSIVGLGLLALVGAYAITFGGSIGLLVLEVGIPTLIGCGFVWYGLRTRGYEADARRADIVSACSLVCGALVALFCGFSIYLLSIRVGFSGGFAQPMLSALSTGIAFGGLIGHVYVEFAHHYRENERLSRAVDASMDGIAVVVDDRHVYTNSAYASLYGVGDGSTLEGTAWTSLYTNAAQASIERTVDPALEERNYWRGTLMGKRADGTTFPQEVTVSALEYGSVVVVRDVTDQRDREQRIQVLNRVLRHNLRNAGTVIQGHANLIGERDAALGRRHVTPIVEEIDALIATADKARGVERTLEQNGTTDLMEATEVVRSVTDRARAAYPDARIISRVDESGSDWNTPRIDGTVATALNELVDNAVEHNSSAADDPTGDGGEDEPTVEIAARIVADESEPRLEFAVTDDGGGIPEAERRAVLEGRETQLDHGSGLGLWLVNWVATNAGGDLRFADRPDSGTVVTLSFPRDRHGAPETPLSTAA